jgi:arginase
MSIDLIYATWPNVPAEVKWYKFAGAARAAGLTESLSQGGHEVREHSLTAEGACAADLTAAFQLAAAVGAKVRESVARGGFPVLVCGSCSVAALGMTAGLGGDGTGILWMDTHPDLNTPETTISGLFEGMALSKALGSCWRRMSHEITGLKPLSVRNVCLYDGRDADPAEREVIEKARIPVAQDSEQAATALRHCERVYLHLDMDVHDSADFRANGYAFAGGPSPAKVRRDLVGLVRELPVAALSVTSLDPDLPDAAAALACATAHIKAVCDARRAARC